MGLTENNLIQLDTPLAAGQRCIRIGDSIIPIGVGGSQLPGGGGGDYYKCASVDTVNQTWTGYKAVLSGGVYSFEPSATLGLTYGNFYTPLVGQVYTSDAAVVVRGLYGAVKISYLRFQVDAVQDATEIQMSEFDLVENGSEVTWSGLPVSSITGDPENDSPSGEGPAQACDNSVLTKWFSWTFNDPSYIQIQFSTPVMLSRFSGYRWYTANDYPGRDPMSWRVMISSDGQSWQTISTVTKFIATTSRQALAGEWNF